MNKGYSLDARSKLILVIVSILFIISVPEGEYLILGFYFILVLALGFIFKPCLKRLVRRTFLVFLYPLCISVFIPFANEGNTIFGFNLGPFDIAVSDNGVITFVSVIIKSFLSVLLLTTLITSTSEMELLRALRKMYLPKMIVSVIFLMYRYVFLAREEFRVGRLSIESRTFSRAYKSFNKKLSFLFGNLLIRSIDRAENVYRSMESRGFDGNFYILDEENNLSKSSIALLTTFVLMLLSIRLVEFFNII
ncbi:MAG: cobalt ECF transporter T component CbiQ [Actinobacteria bacterium]|nr:cobalt ECF transporter T component CbiQ [Actinomycetota bacterium]